MPSYTNVDIEMHQFEISHIKMQRVTESVIKPILIKKSSAMICTPS